MWCGQGSALRRVIKSPSLSFFSFKRRPQIPIFFQVYEVRDPLPLSPPPLCHTCPVSKAAPAPEKGRSLVGLTGALAPEPLIRATTRPPTAAPARTEGGRVGATWERLTQSRAMPLPPVTEAVAVSSSPLERALSHCARSLNAATWWTDVLTALPGGQLGAARALSRGLT